MRTKIIATTLFFFCHVLSLEAQKVIALYPGKAPGSETWNWQEKESYNDMFQTTIVYNVVQPTLTAFLPPPSQANGTAVIIAPGGGFHTLSIYSEGVDVAKWLNTKGVAAFVLKYRLVKSETDDPVKEISPLFKDRKKLDSINAPVIPLAINDGLEAVKYVRTHAKEYGLSTNRIGFMGFSAGGAVAAGVTFNYTAESRPDFVAPIYAYTGGLNKTDVPKDAPPLFVAAATDDQLGLAPQSIKLYNDWIATGKPAELHIYAKGGHGFGMRKKDIPTDTWIERFGDWLDVNGWLWPENPTGFKARVTPKQLKQMIKADEERLRSDWPYLNRYAEENKNLSVSKPNVGSVVFLGNSIFENWKKLDSAWFVDKAYINRGISGQTTAQTLVRFRSDVINLHPRIVIINGGTNDVAENAGPYIAENTMGNIISMVELAQANKIKVILSSVLPASDFPWRPGLEPVRKIENLNAMIKDYAARNDIRYVDFYIPLVDDRKGFRKELSYDGVHPNLAGYKVMELLLQQVVADALKKK